MASSSLTPFRAPREWGDGGNDRRPHVILDISYAGDFIDCRCGQTVLRITDGSAWQSHGGQLMSAKGYEGVRDGPTELPASEERASRAMVTLLAIVSRCTCATNAVEDCPNYVPGDEAEEDNDED